MSDTKQNRIYTLSICLSDIPAHKILKAGKENKLFCEVIVADKKETDQYGYDCKVYCKQSKEEREDANAQKAYCGRGKVTQFASDNTVDTAPHIRNRIYTVNLCLSDIPKESVKVWEKEGKSQGKAYVDICVADKKEVDKYGFDASAYVRQTKEQREAGGDRVYCGRGKMDVFGQSGTPVDANPWAVGNANHSQDNNEHEDQENNYQGSGFANDREPGSTFFNPADITKDDLPF